METKVKKWIEMQYKYELARGDNCSASHTVDRCYGVLLFVINNLFDDYNEKLGEWWNNEMLPKFQNLIECD